MSLATVMSRINVSGNAEEQATEDGCIASQLSSARYSDVVPRCELPQKYVGTIEFSFHCIVVASMYPLMSSPTGSYIRALHHGNTAGFEFSSPLLFQLVSGGSSSARPDDVYYILTSCAQYTWESIYVFSKEQLQTYFKSS